LIENAEIKPRFEHSISDKTDTKVTITLPAITNEEYKRLERFCYEFAVFNTHLSYDISFDGVRTAMLHALHPMSEHYDNLNSAYCYSSTELGDFLSDLYEKNMSVYDSLNGSKFRD
jgi:hypothetical protein